MREAGYTTALAADGVEALEIAAKMGTVDILITDVMMPQMLGDELARRLRQSEPSLKVLYLTGYSDRLFKEKVTLWADEAYLDKPCSVRGLIQAVSLLLFGQLERPAEPVS
jgi:two-component system cell cycle sensor histidine kinase/response regulator CckA